MRIERIEELVDATPLLADLTAADRRRLVHCAEEVSFRADDLLARAGDPADRFFILVSGSVRLETVGAGGAPTTIEVLRDREIVGWSWLIPPYHWHFDVRAVEPVFALAVDGATLRVQMAEDPAFGNLLLRRFSGVMLRRLQAARRRIADAA
jgi:CRP-like cAMP-binding protein